MVPPTCLSFLPSGPLCDTVPPAWNTIFGELLTTLRIKSKSLSLARMPYMSSGLHGPHLFLHNALSPALLTKLLPQWLCFRLPKRQFQPERAPLHLLSPLPSLHSHLPTLGSFSLSFFFFFLPPDLTCSERPFQTTSPNLAPWAFLITFYLFYHLLVFLLHHLVCSLFVSPMRLSAL